MTIDAIIDEALRLDAEYRESLSHNAARYHSARDQFLAHAVNHYAAMCRRVRELEAENVRLKEAMREQFLLQYGKEPDDLQRIVDKLVRERAERIELDNYL